MKFVQMLSFRNTNGNCLVFEKEESDNIDTSTLKKVNLDKLKIQTTRILLENGSLYEIPDDLDIGYYLTIETTFVKKEAPKGNLEAGFSYEDSTVFSWSDFKTLKTLGDSFFNEIAKDMEFNETHEIYEISLISNNDEVEILCYTDK